MRDGWYEYIEQFDKCCLAWNVTTYFVAIALPMWNFDMIPYIEVFWNYFGQLSPNSNYYTTALWCAFLIGSLCYHCLRAPSVGKSRDSHSDENIHAENVIRNQNKLASPSLLSFSRWWVETFQWMFTNCCQLLPIYCHCIAKGIDNNISLSLLHNQNNAL